MFDQSEITESIAESSDFYSSTMPDDVNLLRVLATNDLLNGPVYLNDDGDMCSPFDDGARQFGFESACAKLSDWADQIDDLQVESCFDFDTGESEFVQIDGSRDAIISNIFGRLSAYI